MIRCLVACTASLAAVLAGATVAQAAGRHRERGSLVERHRAVGVAVPIVAGSSTIKVDAVGQVVTDFRPGLLSDNGRATGNRN